MTTAHRLAAPVSAARSPIVVLAAVVLTAGLASPARATDTTCNDGLTDTGGYTCALLSNDSIPDISPAGDGSGTPITWKQSNCDGTLGDDCFEPINLNGTFEWYGTQHSIAYVGSNGYLSFTTGYTIPVDTHSVPSSALPNDVIFAYGDDLDLSSSGTVYVNASATCTGDRAGHACVVVQWDRVAHFDFPAAEITVQLALDRTSNEALVEIELEDGLLTSASTTPQLVGSENSNGSAGLWFKNASVNSGPAGPGTSFIFAAGDTTPPGDVSLVTASSRSLVVDLEWATPPDVDFNGVLVLRRLGGPVNAAPTDTVRYNVGDTIGSNDVVCVASSSDAGCSDASVADGNTYWYRAFAFDTFHNYSTGIDTRGLPRSTKNFKWTFTAGAAMLAPVGIVPGQYVVAVGNDQLLHRMNEADGTRGAGWAPPNLGAAVQDRPMVGDLAFGGPADFTAYSASQGGMLYRHSLDDGSIDGSADAAADAGCSGGFLQGAPVAMADAIDANAETLDDVVIVATRCGPADNRVLVYSHDLGTLHDSYDGDEDGDGTGATLGRANGAPFILYRDTAPNLVYVPVRQDGDDDESLVVLAIVDGAGAPEIERPIYAEVRGQGDVDTTPAAFFFGGNPNAPRVIVGNTAGEVLLFDGAARTAGPGSSLVLYDTRATADGPVKGVAVSTPVPDGAGGFEHWVVWTTDSAIHGMRIPAGGVDLLDTSYWTLPVTAPSRPLVLRWVGGTENTRAYIGTGSGELHEIDVTTGTTLRTYLVEPGATLGDPTFDYNDGVNQGMVVGSTSGMIHWVKLR